VLAELNDAAVELPRWHAVVNHDSGVRHGNQVARIPDATSRGTFDDLQRKLFEMRPENLEPPRLFDGSHVPVLSETEDYRRLRPTPGVPKAMFGQIIDVAGSAAATTLHGAPGRNLAVIGSTAPEAVCVLGTAALSVARQHLPDAARFALCPLVDDAVQPVAMVAERLRLAGHDVDVVERDRFREFLAEVALPVREARSGAINSFIRPHYIFCYGVDAAHATLEARHPEWPSTGLDDLRTVLRHGPEHHTHVFGWWRGISRLKASLPPGQVDDIGSWVVFDVQGQELSTLVPGQIIPWSPRPGRGLFFDRFEHGRPQVIIPFDIEKDGDGMTGGAA
jgi:hypothetical protein